VTGSGAHAQSPAAKMPGTAVRPAAFVGTPAAAPKRRGRQPRCRGSHAHRDDHDVRWQAAAVDELDPERAAVAAHAVDRGAGEDRHPCRAVHRADPLGRLLAEQRGEGHSRLHDRRVQAARGDHARHLRADEAAAHDHDALRRLEHGRETPGVAELAQGHDTVGHEPGWPHRLPADRDHQTVIGKPGAIRELDAASGQVERSRADAELQLDVGVLVGAGRLQQEPLVVDGVAGEQLLGHGRSVVGRGGLGRHHAQASVVALAAQLHGAVHGGHAAADDEHAVRHRDG
jgi:hypothetical protein